MSRASEKQATPCEHSLFVVCTELFVETAIWKKALGTCNQDVLNASLNARESRKDPCAVPTATLFSNLLPDFPKHHHGIPQELLGAPAFSKRVFRRFPRWSATSH